MSSEDLHRKLDLLLHPRVPPLIRSLPHVESLSFFRAEEGLDEIDAREALGLEIAEQPLTVSNPVDDIVMAHVVPKAVTVQPLTTPAVSTKQAGASNQFTPSALQPQIAQPNLVSPLPPPVKPLLSSSMMQISTAPSSKDPAAVQPTTATAPLDEDEEDGEIPTIDMDSDSD
jgi:hypothetical protein